MDYSVKLSRWTVTFRCARTLIKSTAWEGLVGVHREPRFSVTICHQLSEIFPAAQAAENVTCVTGREIRRATCPAKMDFSARNGDIRSLDKTIFSHEYSPQELRYPP